MHSAVWGWRIAIAPAELRRGLEIRNTALASGSELDTRMARSLLQGVSTNLTFSDDCHSRVA
jgi:hypothetical protein